MTLYFKINLIVNKHQYIYNYNWLSIKHKNDNNTINYISNDTSNYTISKSYIYKTTF